MRLLFLWLILLMLAFQPAAAEDIFAVPEGSVFSASLNDAVIYADEMQNRYGISIMISAECDSILSDGFEISSVPTGRTPLKDALSFIDYAEELSILDTALSSYPDGFFQHFICDEAPEGLRILLPGSIWSAGNKYAGVTTVQDGYYNVFLGLGLFNTLNVHHELWHAMEFRILFDVPDAFDRWYTLNPEDFLYTDDYETMTSWESVEPAGEWFVRRYSTISEEEDRATVFEALMQHDEGWWMDRPLIRRKMESLLEAMRPVFGDVNLGPVQDSTKY